MNHIADDGFIWSGKVRFHPELEDRLEPIDSVQPHPENYNNGDVEEIKTSILENGMLEEIKVHRATGFIIGGNHTWMAVKELGSDVIPVGWRSSMDEIGAKKALVALNVTASKAQPDQGMLVSLLDQIDDHDDLLGSGFTKAELEMMRAVNETPLDIDTDPYDGWPTFSVQMDPAVFRDLIELTDDADTNWERIQLLMKMAGWQG